MPDNVNGSRVVLCGPPRGGKKRILELLAQRTKDPEPVVMWQTTNGAVRVSWEAEIDSIGAVRFDAINGPAFYLEQDVKELFAAPASAVIYVLRQQNPNSGYDRQAAREAEMSYFHTYSTGARDQGCAWTDVPWLWVKFIWYGYDIPAATWITEVIPPPFSETTISVNPYSGEGVAELRKAIGEALRR